MEEAEITVMGEKGQIVIPKDIREHLKLRPKTKFLVLSYDDMIMLKKLEMPDLKKDWEMIRQIVEERNKKHGRVTEKEIKKEIEEERKAK